MLSETTTFGRPVLGWLDTAGYRIHGYRIQDLAFSVHGVQRSAAFSVQTAQRSASVQEPAFSSVQRSAAFSVQPAFSVQRSAVSSVQLYPAFSSVQRSAALSLDTAQAGRQAAYMLGAAGGRLSMQAGMPLEGQGEALA